MTRPIRLLGFAILLCVASAARSQELSDVISNCEGCHGENGVSQWDDMPTIGGIDAFTQSEALYIYRDEGRACVESKYRTGDTGRAPTTMCAVAAKLSDVEIEAISAHYAELPFVAAAQDFDAAKAEKGAAIHSSECDRCHSDGGSNPDDEASILAGQRMGYLRHSFAQYAAGERPQDDKMKEKTSALGADDIEALVHYYGSQQ